MLIRDLLSNMFPFQNYELFWSLVFGGTTSEYKYRGIFVLVLGVICTL